MRQARILIIGINMSKRKSDNDLVVFQTKTGALQLRQDTSTETIWATQAQIVQLFAVDQSVVSRHIKKIFEDREVNKKSTMQKMHIANSDKPIIFYSLDLILAAGYRTNSSKAILFRQWATDILKTHVFQGYTINKSRVSKNYRAFMEAVQKVTALLPKGSEFDPEDILILVKLFADKWFSLNAYDRGELRVRGRTKRQVVLTAEKLARVLEMLKVELAKKGEATKLCTK